MWSKSRLLIAPRLTLLTALSLLIGTFGSAAADQLPTLEQSEEAALRQELERIIKEDPDKATQEKARQTLEELDEPKTSPVGRELRTRRERGNKRIVNGLFTFRHSAVAAVLSGREPTTATAWCTGTLIGCDKILTAAHCIDDLPDPTAYLAYFQNLGFVKINDITWPKDDYKFPYADLAILTLAKPVEGIAPVALNAVASPLEGKIATIVGYGRTGGSREDYGIKRDGSVKFGECERGYSGKKLLCWKFDSDVNTTPGDSNTCNADSGGGVFMVDRVGLQLEQRVVGVVSGGRDRACVKDDDSYNTDVFLWRDWLAQSAQGSLSDKTCGRGGSIDDPENLRGDAIKLDKIKSEEAIQVDVPEGTASLRVAMNGEDAGRGDNDFDLLVFNGADTAGNKPICAEEGPGQFAFCEIPNPDRGQWTVLLRRKKGEGLAQWSVTLVKDQASQSSEH